MQSGGVKPVCPLLRTSQARRELGAFGGSLVPLCKAALQHSVDAHVIRAALAALGALTRNASFAKGCVTTLRRFAPLGVDVVTTVCEELCREVDATADEDEVGVDIGPAFIKQGGLSLLVSALECFSAESNALESICSTLGILAHSTLESLLMTNLRKPGCLCCFQPCWTVTVATPISCPSFAGL